eukprot:s3762_g15.t1
MAAFAAFAFAAWSLIATFAAPAALSPSLVSFHDGCLRCPCFLVSQAMSLPALSPFMIGALAALAALSRLSPSLVSLRDHCLRCPRWGAVLAVVQGAVQAAVQGAAQAAAQGASQGKGAVQAAGAQGVVAMAVNCKGEVSIPNVPSWHPDGQAMAESLKSNGSLERLGLENNNIGDPGAEAPAALVSGDERRFG